MRRPIAQMNANAPPKEMAARENLGGRESGSPGGRTETKNSAVADAAQPEQPEHRNDRRRFIVWAVLCGFAQPERLTERIVAEIEDEVAS